MPVFQWVWIHRDMVGYLLCKKEIKFAICDKCFWWDEKFKDDPKDLVNEQSVHSNDIKLNEQNSANNEDAVE